MSEINTKKTAKSELWIRGIYMVLFLAVGSMVATLIVCIAIFQFLSLLLTDVSNPRLRTLSQALAQYYYQISNYLLFLTEAKPYPFQEWPSYHAGDDT